MKIEISVNKDALKKEGDESTLYCGICKSQLRAGPRWVLFCPTCKSTDDPSIKIDSIMSCTHCEKPLVIKLNFDGRITGRCEAENCGDCWSMQDLCLLDLKNPIYPEPRNDSRIHQQQRIIKMEPIENYWFKKEELEKKRNTDWLGILEYLSNKNPQLTEETPISIFINEALVNAAELIYSNVIFARGLKDMWHSVPDMALKHNFKKEKIMAAIKTYTENACPFEAQGYVKKQEGTIYIYEDIYQWIYKQLIYDDDEFPKN